MWPVGARRRGAAAESRSQPRDASAFPLLSPLPGLDLQRLRRSGRRVWFKGFFWKHAGVVHANRNDNRVYLDLFVIFCARLYFLGLILM